MPSTVATKKGKLSLQKKVIISAVVTFLALFAKIIAAFPSNPNFQSPKEDWKERREVTKVDAREVS